jgi:hypothetical protein
VILGHGPAGSSTKTFIHYAQEIKSGKCAGTGCLHVYVSGLGYFRMTLVTAQAPHITAHFVTSHQGCGRGGRETMNFISCCWCRCSLSTMHKVLSVAMEIQFALLSSCEIFDIVVNNNKRSVL